MPQKPNIFQPETWVGYTNEIKARLWAIREFLEPEPNYLNQEDEGADF